MSESDFCIRQSLTYKEGPALKGLNRRWRINLWRAVVAGGGGGAFF